MAKQTTLNSSFFTKLDLLQEDLEDYVEERLIEVAESAVNLSPVDTGAYVTSFSIMGNSSSGGRSRTSNNKPKNQDPNTMREEAFSQLHSDIKSMDLLEQTNFKVTNRSPHANDVEDGGPNWRRSGYGVFRQLRNLYG